MCATSGKAVNKWDKQAPLQRRTKEMESVGMFPLNVKRYLINHLLSTILGGQYFVFLTAPG